MERIYKMKPDQLDLRDYIFRPQFLTHPKELPNVIDLRTQCSPIVDQGELGSCTANAIASGLREYLLLKEKQPWEALSRLFLYYEERLMEGTVNEDNGAEIRNGMKALKNAGVCPESENPYDSSKFTNPPTLENILDAKQYKISEYQRVSNLTMLKAALAEGQTVVIGVKVYSSFEIDEVIETGFVPIPNIAKENLLGYHAILAVGYDNINQLVIGRNSWGINWGDKGYLYLPYQFWTDNLILDMWTGK